MARTLSYKLMGKLKMCNSCMKAKAKAKAVNLMADNLAKSLGEHLCINICGLFLKTIHGNTYWDKIVDEYTDVMKQFL